MLTLSVTQARAALPETLDRIHHHSETVYVTRHDQPVAVMIDVKRFQELVQAERQLTAQTQQPQEPSPDLDRERQRRRDQMTTSAAPFIAWVKPGVSHPVSASDLYASRQVEP